MTDCFIFEPIETGKKKKDKKEKKLTAVECERREDKYIPSVLNLINVVIRGVCIAAGRRKKLMLGGINNQRKKRKRNVSSTKMERNHDAKRLISDSNLLLTESFSRMYVTQYLLE